MSAFVAYLQRPQVHAALAILSYLSGLFWPQYKPVLDQIMLMGTYGAGVTGLHLTDPNAPEQK